MARPEVDGYLWDLIKSEDEMESYEARTEIVTHYQYLVEGTARKIQRKLPPYVKDDDLISYAQLGLLRAMGRYDPEAGPFSRFASAAVYGAVIDGLRQEDFAPRGLRKQQRELDDAIQKLRVTGEVAPSNATIGESMGLSEDEVSSIQVRIERSDIQPQDPHTIRHSLDGVSMVTREVCREFVNLIRREDITTQKVVALKYWNGYSMRHIGELLGIPVEDVRSRHNRVARATLDLAIRLFTDD